MLFVLFVVNSMPTINRRWSEGFLTSWMTRSVSDDCYENRVGSGGLSPILLRFFTTKDTKNTKGKEKSASSRGEFEADHQETLPRRYETL